MQTTSALQNGFLRNATSIKLQENLSIIPEELWQLKDNLVKLDLSGNALSHLPPSFNQFQALRILFLSDNSFNTFPAVLGELPALEMIAFKNNNMKTIPENALPRQLRWLILTNNQIDVLPESIGKCERLEKLMLAGNHLTSLPKSFSQLQNLALLRISANRFESIPTELAQNTELAFLGIAGNPCCSYEATGLPQVDWNSIELSTKLGEGASGTIWKASCSMDGVKKDVALKIFHSGLTSDGSPLDEMKACVAAGTHRCLIDSLSIITGHADGAHGLVLQLIPPDYKILGLPPSLSTCSRDCFSDGLTLKKAQALTLLGDIASAAEYLHGRGIIHGDLCKTLQDEAHVRCS